MRCRMRRTVPSCCNAAARSSRRASPWSSSKSGSWASRSSATRRCGCRSPRMASRSTCSWARFSIAIPPPMWRRDGGQARRREIASRLERNLVVELGLGALRIAIRCPHLGVAEEILRLRLGARVRENLQSAVEAIEHDLRGEDLVAVLEPAAGAHLTLDGHERAALGAPFQDIDEPVVPDDDAVPFGALFTLDVFGCREPQRGDARAGGGGRGLGIAAQAADGDESLIHLSGLSWLE